MDRKLASIQKIVKIDPIPDADKIEKATVLGWEVVVNKNDNFKPDDLIVYIEVDSIMPEKPEYEFLRERKFRIRTIKLRKQTSQGLILPLSVAQILTNKKLSEGDDVTELLKVRKYDPQGDLEQRLIDEKNARSNNKINKFLMRNKWYRRIFNYFFGKPKGGFPSFIKKTDEDRIQLFPHICENQRDTIFSVTEKLDGQSLTSFLVRNKKKFLWFGDEYIFGVCSRRIYLKRPDNSTWWTIAKQYKIEEMLKTLIMKNEDFIAIQGEIIGEGIQKNKYQIKGYDFYAFNLFSNTHVYNTEDMKIELESFGIKTVPILDSNFRLKQDIPQMVEYAKGKSTICNILREGVVIRNYPKNLSFKVINPEFLLKYGDGE